MSVSIFDSNCYKKLYQVEGETWLKNEQTQLAQMADLDYPMSAHSFTGALARFAQDGTAVIYGAGGYNRYFIREDGRIVFSVSHSTSEGRKKAEAAGFDLG